jgi:hypothetical protein
MSGTGSTRRPFEPRGLPYVVRIPGAVAPIVFGPFPALTAAREFVERNPFPVFEVDVLFPPDDVKGYRYQ